jgi:hypothetical protein
MRRLPRPWRALLLCAGVCCLAAGCGGKGKVYKVMGTLTKGGGPLQTSPAGTTVPPGTEETALGIEMYFYPYDKGQRPQLPDQLDVKATPIDPYSATVQPNGDFTVLGPDGKGIPAGRYLVVVRQQDLKPGESPFGPGAADKDKLRGAFNEANSPIVVEVQSDTDDLKIDLAEYLKGGKR